MMAAVSTKILCINTGGTISSRASPSGFAPVSFVTCPIIRLILLDSGLLEREFDPK